MYKFIYKGFTLIEVIIVISILATLSTIGFISYTSYLSGARDASRFTDMGMLKINLKSTKQQIGAYPMPSSPFTIVNNGTGEVYQGVLDENVSIKALVNVPRDPKINNYYLFSVTKDKQYFQIACTLENNENNIALVDGDYKTISMTLFPSLVLAISGSGENIEIHDGIITDNSTGSINRQKFIINNGSYNLPYDFYTALPLANGINVGFTGVINEQGVNLGISSDYFNCEDIYNAGRYLGPGDYTIMNETTGELSSTGCNNSGSTQEPEAQIPNGNITGYAWGESAGWIDFSTLIISGSTFTGMVWGESAGWIDFTNQTTGSDLSLTQDGQSRKFIGRTWGESAGWIDFNTDITNQVTIDSTGNFKGKAWSEVFGWISFDSVDGATVKIQ